MHERVQTLRWCDNILHIKTQESKFLAMQLKLVPIYSNMTARVLFNAWDQCASFDVGHMISINENYDEASQMNNISMMYFTPSIWQWWGIANEF